MLDSSSCSLMPEAKLKILLKSLLVGLIGAIYRPVVANSTKDVSIGLPRVDASSKLYLSPPDVIYRIDGAVSDDEDL